MSRFLRSVTNAFRKRLEPGWLPNEFDDFDNQPTEGSYKRSPYQENHPENNEDLEDSNYTDPSQTGYYKSKQRDMPTEDNEPQNPQSYPANRPSSEGRYEAADVPSNSTRSNENRRTANRRPNNIISPQTRARPTQQQNFSNPTQNPNPPAPPPSNPTPQQPINDIPSRAAPAEHQSNPSSNPIPSSSLLDNFITFLNQNQQPFPVNPNSTLVGFSSNLQQRNRNQNNIFERFRRLRAPYRSSFTPQTSSFTPRTSSFTPRTSSFPLRNNDSNYEIDYPIENVLIDGNVPESMAIKINEAVEHDRFGNAYRRERYAYEPVVQQINIGNYSRMQRRLVENPHRLGMRYVREVTNNNIYPQNLYRPSYETKPFDNIQLMADSVPQLNFPMTYPQEDYQSFPIPVRHYTACALPNDPMRIY